MDLIITTLGAYAHGAARPQAQARKVRQAAGLSDDEWWEKISPYLSTVDYTPTSG